MIVSDGPVLVVEDGLLTVRPATRANGDASPRPAESSRPAAAAAAHSPGATSGGTLVELERRKIEETLERCGWVIEGPAGAATALGLHPNTLRSRLKRLGIVRPA